MSCPARGMGVEIYNKGGETLIKIVMPREGHGSRNAIVTPDCLTGSNVMPREGHGSRNAPLPSYHLFLRVMPREGHGSRNIYSRTRYCGPP